jgi:hypothetical protein
MFTKLKNWFEKRSRTKLYWHYYNSAKGDDFARTCFALLMMELENDLIKEVTRKHPLEQQQKFLMAYECFIMWLIKFNVEKSRSEEFIANLIRTLRDNIRDCGHYEEGVFEEIWEAVQDAMPNCLTPGKHSGVPMPWVRVVTSCTIRGIEIYPIPDLSFATHVMLTFKNVGEFTGNILELSKSQAH